MSSRNISVVEKSRDFTKRELYKMAYGSGGTVIKELDDGTEIQYDAHLIYSTVDKDGENIEILSIMDKEGHVYQCQSATFKDEFFNIVQLMEGEEFAIRKLSGTSKGGRDYVTCELV